MKFIFSFNFMKRIFLILLILAILIGCAQIITTNFKKNNITSNTEKKFNIRENTKSSNICGAIADFENQEWYKSMEIAYKNNYPNEYNEVLKNGKFYIDYSQLGRKQACQSTNFFIFTPWENMEMTGAFYVYNIDKKTIKRSPQHTKYLAGELTEINDDFVFFKGGAGSGECFSEEYGKYFFKENKIEIYKKCNWCMKSFPDEKDCKEVNIIYE